MATAGIEMRCTISFFKLFILVQWISTSRAWLAESRAWATVRRASSTTILGVQATREGAFLISSNVTDGESWLPSMGRAINTLNELTPRNEEESWRRAIQHTNAILDLYNETGRGLSEDLVMSTLENVVQHSTDNPYEVTDELLEDVESLVWRLRDFELVPSIRVLEALWEMQQYHRANRAEKASKQVGRQVNLLTHWREWSGPIYRGRRSRLQPPPESYFLDLLRYAADEEVSMSFTLWELYQSVSQDPTIPCERIVYSHVLKILAQSPSTWSVRQRRVCNDMITQSRLKLDEPPWPSPEQIKMALQATVPTGRAQDAAWLLRTLEMCPERSEALIQECRTLFLKAVLQASDPGSLLYMEQLLFSGKWEGDTLVQWKLLLQKCTLSKETGCGSRAEAVFQQIEKKREEKGAEWIPDAECVYHVLQAYMNEPERSLTHVLKATQLVKRCVTTHDLYRTESKTPVRLFDTLLAAFDDDARTDPRAVKTADDLFRFFMIQHRDGRVRDEEPDRFHLGHILRYHNRQFKKHLLQKGAYKSLEYFRLFRTLFRKKILSSPPDLFNTRQLLGTLARCGEPGFGSVANETLTEALTVESPIHPYALGHMYWCVIKCYCNDDRINEAIGVLKKWEEEFEAHPSSIRMTGAPYQTLINTLAIRKIDHSADVALQIVDRLEKQYQTGNHRVVLRRKMYHEAIQCCGDDSHAQEEIRKSFNRMNFTTLDKP